ncbi:MAG: hypothetical protein PVH61_37175 [Candidatus Aminicenantes bacterium]|jgi:hypothetical protein
MKTRTKEKKLEVKEKHFFYSSTKEQIKDERIFGLGESHFDPSTGTVRVYSYSLNSPELLASDNLFFIEYDSTFGHEMGHYQLTTNTRFGNTIKEIGVLLDGLCLIIIRRMLLRHKRIWIPFKDYAEFKNRDEEIEKLIMKMQQLKRFQSHLIGTWQISQELYAYSWAGWMSNMADSMIGAMFQAGNKEKILSIMKSFDIDPERKTTINEKLREYFSNKEINLENLEEHHIKQLYEDLPSLFGDESDLVELFLNIDKKMAPIYYNRKEDKFKDIEEVLFESLDRYRNEVDEKFKGGYDRHVEALRIFNDYSRGNPSTFVKIIMFIGFVSNLYAPAIPPESVLSSSDPANLESFNKITIDLLGKILKNENPYLDFMAIISTLPEFIDKTNSVKIEEIKNTDLSTVLGTKQWFHSLILSLGLDRGQRKFIQKLLITYKDAYNHYRGLSSTGTFLSFLPLSMRLLLRFFFKSKKIRKKFAAIEGMSALFESMGIKDAKTFFRTIELYGDMLLSGPFGMGSTKEKDMLKPPFAVFFDEEDSILYSNKSFSSPPGRLFMYKHLIGNVKELCLGIGNKEFSILCPAGYVEDRKFLCEGGVGNCWIYNLLEKSSEGKGVLICCKDGRANLLRNRKDEKLVYESAFRLLDKEAEKKRQEISPQEDVIKKIWKPQADRLNTASEADKTRKKSVEPEYDGNIEDLDNYLVKKMQKFLKPIMVPFLIIIRLPIDLDFWITGLLNKFREKKIKSCGRKTERGILDFIKLIQSTDMMGVKK